MIRRIALAASAALSLTIPSSAAHAVVTASCPVERFKVVVIPVANGAELGLASTTPAPHLPPFATGSVGLQLAADGTTLAVTDASLAHPGTSLSGAIVRASGGNLAYSVTISSLSTTLDASASGTITNQGEPPGITQFATPPATTFAITGTWTLGAHSGSLPSSAAGKLQPSIYVRQTSSTTVLMHGSLDDWSTFTVTDPTPIGGVTYGLKVMLRFEGRCQASAAL